MITVPDAGLVAERAAPDPRFERVDELAGKTMRET